MSTQTSSKGISQYQPVATPQEPQGATSGGHFRMSDHADRGWRRQLQAFRNVVRDPLNWGTIPPMPASARTPEYDVALSFAGQDRQYAEALNRVLTSRGVRVFYDRDVEHEMWGRDLYEYLDEIYRKRARYCVMFISKDYAQKLWTSHERKSAQARAFQEREEYILPVRVDDTEIPGVLPTVAYLRLGEHSITEIADLVVRKLGHSSQTRSLEARTADFRTAVEVRFRSLLDPDIDWLLETMRPFLRWNEPELLSEVPILITWPSEIAEWIEHNRKMITSDTWPSGISPEAKAATQKLFIDELGSPEKTRLASGLKTCAALVRDLADDVYANAALSESEIRLLFSTYISSEIVARALQLVSWRLAGMTYPAWMTSFYGFEPNYGYHFVPGLVLVLRNEGEEEILWVDTDFGEDQRLTKYLYLPSSMLIRYEKPLACRNVLLKAVVPQLVVLAAEGMLDWLSIGGVLKYPNNYYLRTRGESFFDPETLSQPQYRESKWRERLRAWCRARVDRGSFEELGLPQLGEKALDP